MLGSINVNQRQYNNQKPIELKNLPSNAMLSITDHEHIVRGAFLYSQRCTHVEAYTPTTHRGAFRMPLSYPNHLANRCVDHARASYGFDF